MMLENSKFTKIDEELFEELEEILVMSDIGVNTSTEICDILRKKIKEQGITDPTVIKNLMKEIIAEMLGEDEGLSLNTQPSVILVIGVNGVGKTTTIGKLAASYKAEGKSVILAAADTFRAAAIDQLDVWAERAGVDIVKHKEGADPAAVIFDTISAAKARGTEIIICDTAGRLHNKKNLMDELSKMNRIITKVIGHEADDVLLIIDATTGQNGVLQAKAFFDAVRVTGIVLTKMDSTSKGGIILAIKDELNIPVKFVCFGEQLNDIEEFDLDNYLYGLTKGMEE